MLVETSLGRIEVRVDGIETSVPPLLLIHAFASSLLAWDPVVDLLGGDRRLIRLDLLGHGGSDKPRCGYTMAEQAQVVAAVLDRLDVPKVVAVGHSGGGDIVVAMAEGHLERLQGVALLGTPPNLTYIHLPIAARLVSAPILGQVIWSLMADSMIANGLTDTFAPGFQVSDQMLATLIADLRRMTHHSYVHARRGVEGYRKQEDLTQRIGDAGIPLMVVFGDQDQWADPIAAEHWADTTDARIEILPGVGHTPMTEAPGATAGLITSFARDTSRL